MFDWQPFGDMACDVIGSELGFMNVLEGSVSSGKTVCSLVRWLDYVVNEAPPGKLAMIGKSERTLKRNILDLMLDMYGPGVVRVNYGSGEACIANKPVYLFGANDIRAEHNIRGGTWAGAYLDELTLYQEDFFTMLLSRLRVRGAKLIATTNPDSPYHWFKVKFLDRVDILNKEEPNHLVNWKFKLDDNLSLDPAYVARLKQQYVGLWYKRYIEGLWALAEGAVYGGLMSDTNHVLEKDVPFINKYFIGVDFATSAATAYVLIGLGIDNCLYVLDEFYWSGDETKRDKAPSELAQDFITWQGDRLISRVYIDPSAKAFATELQRVIQPPIRKGFERDVSFGIGCVSTLIGNNLIKFVVPKLPRLMGELSNYVWDDKYALIGKDKPVKEKDHCLDALRYCVVGLRGIWRNWLPNNKVLIPNGINLDKEAA